MSPRPLPEDSLILKRPPQRWLDSFRIQDVGNDTVGSYIERRFSLCIFCVECPRVTEWAPAELANRYGERPGLRIADIATRLTCSCGSQRIAVGPRYNKLTEAERQALGASQVA
jgi:hypothetical protein